jgi:glycosyltransferase involved in cell wall biosynthesis
VTVSPSVLVDATAIPRNRGGVGRYLEHLLPALDTAGQRMTIAAKEYDSQWLAAAAPNSRIVVPSGIGSRPARLLWEQFGLPRLAHREGVDLIFSPHYTMPVFAGRPVVVTLHDATFFSHPELHSRGKRLFFRSWIRYSLRRSAAVIVPSKATQSELVRWAAASAAHITVAYHGVNTATFHEPSPSELDAARELVGREHWIGFLGTLEPRKNVSALVAAFAGVVTDVAHRYPDLTLALAGGNGWDAALDGAIAASPAKDRIAKLGFVADSDLAGFLGGSLAVAYPSLGEGFGLPVLEAMASGAAVVTTPFLALPEVGGDVAVYSQPDAASIGKAITALLLDDDDRGARARAGVARAAEFGWDSSAATHAAVFEAVAR